MNTVEALLGGPGASFTAPLPAGSELTSAVARSLRRETTLAWLRTRGGPGRRPLIVRRMPSPRLAGGVREGIRRHLGAGWVQSTAAANTTDLARVLSAAAAVPTSHPSVGADGSVRLPALVRGVPVVLRIGSAHTPEDPRRARRALLLLEDAGAGLVPRPLAAGRVGDFAWALEERLPGSRPLRLDASLLRDAVAFVGSLPAGSGPYSPTVSAAVLLDAVPAWAEELRELAHRIAGDPLSRRPVLRHGDFWLGNCLRSREGRLSGVVDWDAWAPTALPGADLLHLLATEERLRRRVPLGTVWLGSPWNSTEFVEAARTQWPEWADDPAARRTVGLDWWLHHVAADVLRVPGRALDTRWVEANVTRVLSNLGR